jgi:hypothetical protein
MRCTQPFVRHHFPVVLLLLGFLLGVVPVAQAAGRIFSRFEVPFVSPPSTKAPKVQNGGSSSGPSSASVASAPVYTFTKLDVPFAGARNTVAWGINGSRQIVGNYFDSTRGKTRGFFDDGGVFTTIDVPFTNFSWLLCLCGINDSDKFVGEYVGTNGWGNGFLDSAGVFTLIDFPGAIASGTFGINNSGQIAGDYRDTAKRLHGFLRTSVSDLVAAYAFNEGSGTTASDSSGNGNTGTVVNNPTWTTGKVGSALLLNGTNQYVHVPFNPSFNLSGDLTVAGWVKDAAHGPLLAKHNGSISADYAVYIHGSGIFDLYGDGLTPAVVSSTRAIPADHAWHHVAVTRQGSTVTFYLDGSAAGSRTMSGSFGANASPVDLGCDITGCNSAGELLQGSIDEVRLYNRALSASEIQTVMNATTATTPPPQQVTQFSTIDVPGSTGSAAAGINIDGLIVGGSYNGSIEHGLLYNKGQLSTIDVPGASSTELEGINKQGQIVATYWDSAGTAHGALYSQGAFFVMDVPFPGATHTAAYGINDLGDIVGVYADSAGNHGFIATPNP